MHNILDLNTRGRVIRTPPGEETGYWAGAPGVFFDPAEKAFYLTYRLRRPRGIAPDRGGESRIARSTDLETFTDVWSVTKDVFATASIERCGLYRGADGRWRYFPSYVDPADGRWLISMMPAARVEDLNPADARPLFTAAPLGLEGIKDPWIFEEQGTYYMLASVALPTAQTSAGAHSTSDIYNTGECLSATGLAISQDLDRWEWAGVVFAPEGDAWDRYCRRINSVVKHRGRYFAFYDGSASHKENYEEKTGLAVSDDLKQWKSLTPEAPWLTSPHATGSLRYIDALVRDGQLRVFYEITRADGAHELRLAEFPSDILDQVFPE
jgi:predicted GH43/DUF377 family glycosyl hydrolase